MDETTSDTSRLLAVVITVVVSLVVVSAVLVPVVNGFLRTDYTNEGTYYDTPDPDALFFGYEIKFAQDNKWNQPSIDLITHKYYGGGGETSSTVNIKPSWKAEDRGKFTPLILADDFVAYVGMDATSYSVHYSYGLTSGHRVGNLTTSTDVVSVMYNSSTKELTVSLPNTTPLYWTGEPYVYSPESEDREHVLTQNPVLPKDEAILGTTNGDWPIRGTLSNPVYAVSDLGTLTITTESLDSKTCRVKSVTSSDFGDIPTWFIAPVHVDGAEKTGPAETIMSIIPVMVTLGILIAVVRVMSGGRNDESASYDEDGVEEY